MKRFTCGFSGKAGGAAGFFLAGLLACGCGSLDRYFPETVGLVGEIPLEGELSLSIRPEKTEVVRGDPVVFNVTLSNSSSKTFCVLRHPDIYFSWIYPTGSRDNFLVSIPDRKRYRSEELVELKPGGTHELKVPISTYYFPSTGITEFKAVYKAPANENPSITNFGPQRAVSNRYGVLIDRRRT